MKRCHDLKGVGEMSVTTSLKTIWRRYHKANPEAPGKRELDQFELDTLQFTQITKELQPAGQLTIPCLSLSVSCLSTCEHDNKQQSGGKEARRHDINPGTPTCDPKSGGDHSLTK